MEADYLNLLEKILDKGVIKGDRTGTGTRSLFGEQLRFDLRRGFPLLTTKKLPFRWIAEELLWFLSGSTDEGELRERGVDIWKEWATEEQCARFGRKAGDLGPIYGHQWRNYDAIEADEEKFGPYKENISFKVLSTGYFDCGIDQIANALDLLQNSPDSRRIIVSGWNPREATQVALPPCHTLFQFETHLAQSPPIRMPNGELASVTDGVRVLSCHMYQRSADVFLGVPFNIASYALLTQMFAHVLGYALGDLIISFGDVHIYSNHVDQVTEQLRRAPRSLPTLVLKHSRFEEGPMEQLLRMTYEDMELLGYKPHPKIVAEVAV